MAVITQEVANTLLIPVYELAPGAITAHRNKIRDMLVAIAGKDLNLRPNQFIIRDIRWVEDIVGLASAGVTATVNDWTFTTAASATTGFVTVTGDRRMSQNRYLALYGARDLRLTYGSQASVTTNPYTTTIPQCVSQIKIDVGGGTRAIWDLCKVQGGGMAVDPAGIAMSAVIIPQLATYNIYYYKMIAVNSTVARIVLMGLVCEPRGIVVSP